MCRTYGRTVNSPHDHCDRDGTKTEKVGFVPVRDSSDTKTEKESRNPIPKSNFMTSEDSESSPLDVYTVSNICRVVYY